MRSMKHVAPPAAAETFASILERRLSRRDALAAGLTATVSVGIAGALPVASATAKPAGRAAALPRLEPSTRDALLLAPGYRYDVVAGWGDPITTRSTGFAADSRRTLAWLDSRAAERQAASFGENCDAIAYFPTSGQSSARGVLCVNHEYVVAELAFAGLPADAKTRARERRRWIEAHPQAVAWMQAAHGVSVIEVERGLRGWRTRPGGRLARRITANTPCGIMGPARGADLMRTVADPSGTRALGTFANCAGGKTPWGTYLTAEENIQDYFGGAEALAAAGIDEATRAAHARWPLLRHSAYGWEWVDPRFDLLREPREPLRHGWIVEIDPRDPAAPPRKRTALGRFCHEGANTIVARDGRVVAYMGDDAKFEHVYKFVTRGRFDPANPGANRDLLDEGTLYAARFDASGRGRWLPLVHDENGPLNTAAGFRSQADVVIKCRAAASLLGATPMDRPEDVEPSPLTGRVYVALTKNGDREPGARGFMYGREVDFDPNPANPRPDNDFGHIVEMIEDGDDATGETFSWNVFLLAGDPRVPGGRFLTQPEDIAAGRLARGDTYYAGFPDRSQVSPLACPDNLGFDPQGRLWIVTDAEAGLVANNGCYVVPTQGPDRGLLRQIASGPVGSEVCGCEFTPDGRTLFLAIQHPGEGGVVERPVSHWPDGGSRQPRSAVVAVTREDGQPL